MSSEACVHCVLPSSITSALDPTLSTQCRLNHGPNGPLARAPELQGPRAAGSGNFFINEFCHQNIDWLSGFNWALKFIPKVCPSFIPATFPLIYAQVSNVQLGHRSVSGAEYMPVD